MSSVHFSICYFSWCVNYWKLEFFLRDMVHNKCANILSTWFDFKIPWHMKAFCMHLIMGHIVSSLHILKERIFFFMCILSLFYFIFLLGLCLFSFPHLLNFSQTCFVFPNFIGGESCFLKSMIFIGGGGLLLFIGGSCLCFL